MNSLINVHAFPASFTNLKRKLLVVLACLFAVVVSAQPRIAVIPLDSPTKEISDVLTVTLTGFTNVVMLERAEVDRIVREQSLVALATTNIARIGQLLNADGLIVLQAVNSPFGSNVTVRLVSVKSGVVVGGSVYALPVQEPLVWGKLEASKLASLIPKLQVEPNRMLAISLINLRSAVNTRSAVQLEQMLSGLLFHRLIQETEVFVLERREMEKVAWEKTGLGEDNQAFRSGSYLLEGTIDRDGAKADTLMIHARLARTGAGNTIEVQVSGPRSDLKVVIDALVLKLMEALKREPDNDVWNADAEAARYEEESVWASRWKNWREAYVAADSAYALGLRTENVMEQKVRALIEQSHTPKIELFDENRRVWVTYLDRAGWVYDPVRNAGYNTNAPTSEVAPNALESLRLYHFHCMSSDTNRWRTNGAWLKTGIYALQTSAEVLRHHYFYSQRTQRFDDTLPELRAAARDVANVLRITGDFSQVSSGDTEKADGEQALLKAIAACGSFWGETAQDAIGIYRGLIGRGDYDRLRFSVLLEKDRMYPDKARSWKNPLWVAWTAKDMEAGKTLWKQFVTELQQSSNQTERAEAALFRLHAAVFDPDIALASEQYYHAVMDESHVRFSTNVDFSLNDAFETLLESKGRQTLRRQRLLDRWKDHWFARYKHYLQTASTHSTERVRAIQTSVITSEQAQELLPVINEYASRFPSGDWITSSHRYIRDAAQKPLETLGFAAAPDSGQPKVKTVNPATPVLTLPKFVDAGIEGKTWPIQKWIFREGKLFAAVGNGKATVVGVIDLGGAKWTVEAAGLPYSIGDPLDFEVIGNDVFWIDLKNTIGRRTADGTVKHYEVGAQLDGAKLQVASNRLFVVSKQLIVEFHVDSGEVSVLASTRRRPALHGLDEWTWPDVPTIAVGHDGELLAAYGLVVWANTGGWRKLPDLPFVNDRLRGLAVSQFGPRQFLVYSATFETCRDQISTAQGQVETLLSDRLAYFPRWNIPFNYPVTPGFSSGQAAQHSYDGTNLLILMPERNTSEDTGSAENTSRRHATLFLLEPQWEMPRVIPLRFDTAAVPTHHRESMLPTPTGLLFVCEDHFGSAKGFSFVSWTELRKWVTANYPDSRNIKKESSVRGFDANKDGMLDADELTILQISPGWAARNSRFHGNRLMLTFDENQDGRLDDGEAATLAETATLSFERHPNQDKDIQQYRNSPALLMARFDADKNGTLEKDEVTRIFETFRSDGL